MTDKLKPYRVVRKYLQDDVMKTYIHDYDTLDKVYKSIIKIINDSIIYTFDKHRIVIRKNNGTIVTAELRNQLKPCIIPLKELIGSHITDEKWSNNLTNVIKPE